MAIRLRIVDGHWIALCAAETSLRLRDVYLDDGMHGALSDKFRADFIKMGFIKPVEVGEEDWIKEKATELYNYLYYETFNLKQVTDFIRSIIKDSRRFK